MKVVVNVTREFEMDEQRVLNEPGFDPPAADASIDEKRRWLRESFWELCGWDRDADHVDGTFVQNVDEDADADFFWPEALR